MGNSALVAQDAQNKLFRINKNCFSPFDYHTQLLHVPTLSKGDLAILISYSGESLDILSLIPIIKEKGATTLAITRFGGNSLSRQSDIVVETTSKRAVYEKWRNDL